MSADGRHAAVGTAVFVWDGDLGRQIGRLPVPVGTAGMAFSADGSRIATFGLDGAVRVWDTDRLQLLLTLTDDDQHAGIAFTRDGRLVAARSTGGLTVWQTQKPMCTFCFGIQRNQASR
jgi:WD40 repeat protein